jgi:hypothetical protein
MSLRAFFVLLWLLFAGRETLHWMTDCGHAALVRFCYVEKYWYVSPPLNEAIAKGQRGLSIK